MGIKEKTKLLNFMLSVEWFIDYVEREGYFLERRETFNEMKLFGSYFREKKTPI